VIPRRVRKETSLPVHIANARESGTHDLFCSVIRAAVDDDDLIGAEILSEHRRQALGNRGLGAISRDDDRGFWHFLARGAVLTVRHRYRVSGSFNS